MSITFDQLKHQYKRNGTIYISATTLIKKYEPPFDSSYWSLYKSIKKVLERYGEWRAYKWSCGGWESVVEHFRTYRHTHADEIYSEQKRLLLEWQHKGKEAREMGTKVHKELEDEVNDSLYVEDDQGDKLVPSFAPVTDPLASAGENQVMTEVIIYNDKYKIAGMIDRVDKKGNIVNLRDHKTSKEITKNAFRDETLKPPVKHLPNANYYVYSLQLSLYAWMLSQFGYEIGTLNIDHRSRNDGNLIQSYPVKYLMHDITNILKHYGEQKRRI